MQNTFCNSAAMHEEVDESVSLYKIQREIEREKFRERERSFHRQKIIILYVEF